MTKPIITLGDMNRIVRTNKWLSSGDLASNRTWMKNNGLNIELISAVTEALTEAVVIRIAEDGESFDVALHNILMTAFQLGWESSREFGGRD